MAISAPQDSRPPEETDNPGQQKIDDLVDKEFNPDDYQRRQAQPAGNPTDPRGNDSAADDSSDPRGDLKTKEDEPDQHENTVGRGYTSGAINNKRTGFWRGPASGKGWRRKRLAISAAILAATAAASIAIFLALLPLKILHIVNNLESKFYATSQNALQNETDNLLKRYITQHVLPSYKSCGTTISRECSVNIAGTNPVTNLYKSWANARLENKLATDYGIEFQKRADGWYLKTPSTDSKGINIGKEGEHIDSGFQKANIGEIRQAVKNETRWYQLYVRFKVGKLLEEKYGIRRCLIFCSLTDPLAQKVADQKLAAKLFLTQRVIVPRNQTLGIALQCLLSDCSSTDTKPTDATPGDNAAEAGAPENAETDTAVRDGLANLAKSYSLVNAAGEVDSGLLDNLLSTYKDISEKGFQNYLITKALTPIIGDFASSKVSDAVPYAGWINLAAQFVNAANDSSKNLKKLSYITNATAAVSLFAMYRTYADEIKTGHVNSAEVGSLIDSLAPGNRGSSTDPEIGGNVGAEGSPIYSKLIDGQKPSSETASAGLSLFSKYFADKALADTASPDSKPNAYLCNNGQPVPTGSPVCPEETLGIGNQYANLIHEYLNNNPLGSSVVAIAQLWKSSIGQIFQFLNDVVGGAFKAIEYPLDKECDIAGSIPGGSILNPAGPYCSARSAVKDAANALVQAVTQWLIPDPFSTNMSGGRTFDMMAAGADVAGNDSAHTTLGGQQLSDQQVAIIQNEQRNNDLLQYNNQPFFTRLKDTNSPYSPISRFAMAMPTSLGSAQQSMASIFSNPLHNFSHIFSTIFSPTRVLAATAQPDPFGVVQYGYPAGTIPSDPEAYWDQNCSDNAAYAYRKTNDWNIAASQTRDQNEMPLNASTNPCLLIMATTGSAGGLFDSSLLTQDDLAGSTASSSGSPAPASQSSFYFVGDSLTVGMDEIGNLTKKLTSAGDTVTKVEATVGDSVSVALPKVKSDSSQIGSANTVVVALGTNDGENTSEASFVPRIKSMLAAIRSSNPKATIFWMNCYKDGSPNAYKGIDKAISDQSSSLNYRVIDWHSEATKRTATYAPFDSALHVHPSNYDALANFVINEVNGG